MIDLLKTLITAQIDDATVEVNDVTGSNDHFALLVVSDTFIGMSLLEQHRMVMNLLKQELKEKVHAVQIKTSTYEKYKK